MQMKISSMHSRISTHQTKPLMNSMRATRLAPLRVVSLRLTSKCGRYRSFLWVTGCSRGSSHRSRKQRDFRLERRQAPSNAGDLVLTHNADKDVAQSTNQLYHACVQPTILTQVLPLADDTISIRSLDWDRDRFDIEFGLEKGTTYNSYLICGDKTALVDASHEKFHSLYLETLDKQLQKLGRSLVTSTQAHALSPSIWFAPGRKIDYIIVSHTEPDHSGLIPAVLDRHPDAIVVGSKVRADESYADPFPLLLWVGTISEAPSTFPPTSFAFSDHPLIPLPSAPPTSPSPPPTPHPPSPTPHRSAFSSSRASPTAPSPPKRSRGGTGST